MPDEPIEPVRFKDSAELFKALEGEIIARQQKAMRQESVMRDSPYGIAARYNDAEYEERDELASVVHDVLGLDVADVLYLCQNRALAFMRISEGRAPIPHSDPAVLRLDAEQSAWMTMLAAMVLDGIMIGVRAHKLDNDEDIARDVEAMARLRAAGWEVGDDGDPYQPES